MHYTDIAREIIDRGLRKKFGATPAASVNVAIHQSIKNSGAGSPFVKSGGGMFMLKDSTGLAGSPGELKEVDGTSEESESSVGIIHAFGMYWRREAVPWEKDAELLGEQQGGSMVNFCDQRGVYLLYDGREIIYVGRTTDQPLGRRMFQHTLDRLSTRWDRFSWFGLSRVTPEGRLERTELKDLSGDVIIATMEALLIEGLEPRQNRKRGDDFRAVEYIQSTNPKIRKRQTAALISEFTQRLES